MTGDSTPEFALTARWIIPVEGPPLPRGTITIRGDRVIALEPHGFRTPDVDVGNAAILPGFVNAHTHLDLSDLRGKAPPGSDFTRWLRGVIRHRRQRSEEETALAVRVGLNESLSFGTTLVGDIAGGGLSWNELSAAPLRAVVFCELLGLPRSRAKKAWAEARAWLNGHPGTPTCKPGLSPHAPYSVRAALFRIAGRIARARCLPLAVHVAESGDEIELLANRSGPFVGFLSEAGAWDPHGLVHDVNSLLKTYEDNANLLLVHANYLSPTSPLPRGAAIVYCPRTHAAFGHPVHPVEDFLAAGVRVALGTDSLASNPDLNLLDEARFLHERHPAISGAAIVRMATLSGAQALGWERETGSLAPGKSADLVVVPLEGDRDDPHEQILQSSFQVSAVMFQGRWVHGDVRDAPYLTT
jgi:cytosine/adenosine deaminase-related metal-dependent hydrolase